MKNQKTKVFTTEAKTFLNNRDLKKAVREALQPYGLEVVQIQVNEIKKEK